MSEAQTYYDYCRGEPKKPDVVELSRPQTPEHDVRLVDGMVVEEERFDSLSGLYRRLAELLGPK